MIFSLYNYHADNTYFLETLCLHRHLYSYELTLYNAMDTTQEAPAHQQLQREASKASTVHADNDGQLHPHLTVTKSLEHAPKRQIAIIVFVSLAQFIQMYPYGAGIGSALSVATSFRNDSDRSTQIVPSGSFASISAEAGWIAASYPLTQGTFVLMGGRLGAVFGHKKMLMVACSWWLIWSLICGFAPNLIALCVFRALSGVGGGMMTYVMAYKV
jgi:hypothetical protein